MVIKILSIFSVLVLVYMLCIFYAIPYEDGTTHDTLNAICYEIVTVLSYAAVFLGTYTYIPYILALILSFLVIAMLLGYSLSIIKFILFTKNKK